VLNTVPWLVKEGERGGAWEKKKRKKPIGMAETSRKIKKPKGKPTKKKGCVAEKLWELAFG